MQTEKTELTKPQSDRTDLSGYLVCERKEIYALLMLSAGMMEAYTYDLRGGVFCNAQTANVVLMSIALGRGDLQGSTT